MSGDLVWLRGGAKKRLGAWSLFLATSTLSVYLVWPPYFVFYHGVGKNHMVKRVFWRCGQGNEQLIELLGLLGNKSL